VSTSIQEMQWVLRAQCGDRDALEALLRSVQPALGRYVTGIAGTADGDALLQDVLVQIIRKLGSLEEPALFRPWILRIASRQAFRHVRKRRIWLERHDDDSALGAIPALEARPPDDAAILELPLGTVKSRLAYGLKSIRQHLLKAGDPT
jgi:RNA polymerase sigma-70 factor (ECF subfamily)